MLFRNRQDEMQALTTATWSYQDGPLAFTGLACRHGRAVVGSQRATGIF